MKDWGYLSQWISFLEASRQLFSSSKVWSLLYWLQTAMSTMIDTQTSIHHPVLRSQRAVFNINKSHHGLCGLPPRSGLYDIKGDYHQQLGSLSAVGRRSVLPRCAVIAHVWQDNRFIKPTDYFMYCLVKIY